MNAPLPMADKYEAGCGFGDVACMTEEGMVRFFLDIMSWVVDTLAWAMNLGSITTDSSYWTGAITMSSFWLGITSFVGVVIIGAVGVTKGVVKGERDTITRSVLGVAFSVPSTLLSIWIVGYLLDALETLTAPLIAGAFGGDMGEALMNYLIPNASEYLAAGSEQARGDILMKSITESALGLWAPAGLFVCIIVATVVVIAINVLRNILLQMLIAAAPLVFMMMPLGIGKEIITSWAKLTAMVFIMKPMVVMYVAMMIAGMVNTGRTVWEVEGIPYAVGLLMVIVVPFAVMGMFQFFGVDTDAGGREVMQGGSRAAGMIRGRRGPSSRGPQQPGGAGGRRQQAMASAPASRTVQSSSGQSAPSPKKTSTGSGGGGAGVEKTPSRPPQTGVSTGSGTADNSRSVAGSGAGSRASGDSSGAGPRNEPSSGRPVSAQPSQDRTLSSPAPASGKRPTNGQGAVSRPPTSAPGKRDTSRPSG